MKEPVYTVSDIVDVLTAFSQGVESANTVMEALEHYDRVSKNMEPLDPELILRGLQECTRIIEACQRTEL